MRIRKQPLGTSNITGKRIEELRKEKGWTQVELADYAGVGLRFVRELEQNKSTLRLDKVNQVLNLFSACVGPVPIDRSIYADG